MFNQKRGFISGFITCALLCVLVMNVFAAPIEKLITATYNSIKIVVDGKEIKPTDATGNTVEPFIYNGTTYLPVRAVANAFGKAVYWDNSAYTVYLGTMDGKLEVPSLRLGDAVNVGTPLDKRIDLTDNYGNSYSLAYTVMGYKGDTFETLLNMKYSRFRGTAYMPEGMNINGTWTFRIEADGIVIYSSPPMDKTSYPLKFDIDVSGYNDFKLISYDVIHYGDCGFYQ